MTKHLETMLNSYVKELEAHRAEYGSKEQQRVKWITRLFMGEYNDIEYISNNNGLISVRLSNGEEYENWDNSLNGRSSVPKHVQDLFLAYEKIMRVSDSDFLSNFEFTRYF